MILALLAFPFVLQAQNNGVPHGVESVTAADVKKHIYVIANDSMMGRDTPSPGLEMTARYVASRFQAAGLKPGGDSGSFLQRYPVSRRRTDGAGSSVVFTMGALRVLASAARDARYISGPKTGRPVSATAVLLGGTLTPDVIASLDLAGKSVLYVLDFARPLTPQQQGVDAVMERHPATIVLVSNRDTATFTQRVAQQFQERVAVGDEMADGPSWVEVHERTLAPVFAAAEIDSTGLHGAAPLVRPLPGLLVTSTMSERVSAATTAPNVVGIIEGTDPVLKNEYIVFSAHMDHDGIRSGAKQDSIMNGADDDASGTVGVIALATAFSTTPPRRSLIFLTVSGEEKGLWGSDYFAGHPPVPMARVVADLNMDMIGRNWRDTIVVIGKEHSDLGATLNRVSAAHPELGMHAIDDLWPQESFYYRSDHFNFARRGVPVLFFFNGVHADYHQPSDSPDKIDYEKESRIIKLVYYTGQDVANAASRPQWNAESYRRIVQVKEPETGNRK